MPDVFVAKRDEKDNLPPSINRKKKFVKPTRRDMHIFSAFRYHPDKVGFLNKSPEEKVLLILRRHPITNLSWILLAIVMLFAPIVLFSFPILEIFPGRFQFIAVLGWYLLTAGFVFEKFLSWYYNVNIVTDKRVLDVDFVNLIYREMTDANTEQIQDVTVRMGSVIRTMFNFGDVLIQTASQVPRIVFEAVPKPDKVSKVLRDLRVKQPKETKKEIGSHTMEGGQQ